MDLDRLQSFLGHFPLSSACLSDYVVWLGEHPEADLNQNDLMVALQSNDVKRMGKLEQILTMAREILCLNEASFKAAFGFSSDLFATDPEKVHDILAEPVLVVDLADQGFHTIRKLPKFIKKEGQRLPSADFTAMRDNMKFAIELKTIRMENKPRPRPGKPMGNSLIPSWWRTMFFNNIKTKIESKNRKILDQLKNTKSHFDCERTMLALNYRRMGPSTLMENEGYHDVIRQILEQYPQIDHIFFKDYFGEIVACSQRCTL